MATAPQPPTVPSTKTAGGSELAKNVK